MQKRRNTKINICTLFSNRYVVFCLMTCALGTFNIVFWGGWLSTSMANPKYNFNTDNLGYVIGSQSFVYLVGCLALPYTCEAAPRRLLFCLATYGFSFCIFMMGPSKILNFPDNVWLIIAAFPLLGLF